MIADTFIPGDGPAYRLDPRPKILLLLFFTVAFFTEDSLYLQAGLLAAIMAFTGFSLGAKLVFRPVRLILPVLILTVLLTPPFNREGRPLITAGDIILLSSEGLGLTLRLVIRFSGITALFFLFFSTTRIPDFILALRYFGMPYRAALTVDIALRYIPYMYRVYGNISDAHKLRAAGRLTDGGNENKKMKKKGFSERLGNVFPVLTSVLIQAVKSIPWLSMALDSRGFGRAGKRTSVKELPSGRKVAIHFISAGIIMAGCIFAGIRW